MSELLPFEMEVLQRRQGQKHLQTASMLLEGHRVHTLAGQK